MSRAKLRVLLCMEYVGIVIREITGFSVRNCVFPFCRVYGVVCRLSYYPGEKGNDLHRVLTYSGGNALHHVIT